jgi:hypothetical protein
LLQEDQELTSSVAVVHVTAGGTTYPQFVEYAVVIVGATGLLVGVSSAVKFGSFTPSMYLYVR